MWLLDPARGPSRRVQGPSHNSGITQTSRTSLAGRIVLNRLSVVSKMWDVFSCVCLCFPITRYCLETEDETGRNKD